MITAYPFVAHADPKNIRHFDTPEAIRKFLQIKFCGGACFGTDELTRNGQYKEMGFVYNFRAHLKKWLIQDDNGHLSRAYAPSVTALRKALYLSRHCKVWAFPA